MAEDEVTKIEEPLAPLPKGKPCNIHIHELARPKTIALLHLWNEYRHRLGPEKCRKLKQYLQEAYSMSPEDAERYFEQIHNNMQKIIERRKRKLISKRKWRKKIERCEIRRAYKFFLHFLHKGLKLAYQTPIPPLIPSHLRDVMDVVLDQLCELHDIAIPKEDEGCITRKGQFLKLIAYHIAAVLETVYYEVNMKKNLELEEIEKQETSIKLAEAEKVSEHENVLKVTNYVLDDE